MREQLQFSSVNPAVNIEVIILIICAAPDFVFSPHNVQDLIKEELQRGFFIRFLDALPGEVAVPDTRLSDWWYGRCRRQ